LSALDEYMTEALKVKDKHCPIQGMIAPNAVSKRVKTNLLTISREGDSHSKIL